MKTSFKKYSLHLLVLSILVLPSLFFYDISYADNKFLPIIKCGNPKPCTFIDAIETFNRIVNWFVSIAATIGALTMAYAGAIMLLNPGNPGKLEEAKEMFKKIIIGLIWILVAWIIVVAVSDRFIDPDINATRFLK